MEGNLHHEHGRARDRGLGFDTGKIIESRPGDPPVEQLNHGTVHERRYGSSRLAGLGDDRDQRDTGGPPRADDGREGNGGSLTSIRPAQGGSACHVKLCPPCDGEPGEEFVSEKLHGIFTPHMVPLDTAGRIDEGELRRYLDWLIDRGVHGLYPNGSTGEFTRFAPEERRRIVRIACEQAAGRVPVLAGAAEANVRETLDACAAYAGFGARAVAIVSPFYYKLSAESVYAYFREIALNAPVDVTLYNIPSFASPIDVPTIARLAELPRIVGIKDSSGDLAFMMRMIRAVRPNRPDFAFLTGWEAVLMPMLLMGCDGGTHATSGVAPELTRRIYDLTTAGRLDEARDLQFRLLELFDALVYGAEFPEGIREAVRLRGFRMGDSRQPASDNQKLDLQKLSGMLLRILSDLGLPDDRSSACDACSAGTGGREGRAREDGPELVTHIAQGVVEELRRKGMLS